MAKQFLAIFLIFLVEIFQVQAGINPLVQDDKAFINIGSYVGSNFVKSYFAPRFFRATASNAHAICRAYNMDLAMLETFQEFTTVSYQCRVFETLLTELIFIDGMTLISKSPTEWFFTRTGEKIPYTMTWDANQPNDYTTNGPQRCLALTGKGKFLANDLACINVVDQFLCEKKQFFGKSETFNQKIANQSLIL